MSQTALVTGATSGIGESLCLLLASDGYNLVTVARDEKALNEQAEKLRCLDIDVTPVPCDLSEPDAARTIFKKVQEKGKDIEILINDAGYSPAGQFSDLSVADIRAMIQVSVTSLAELTSVFLHPMLERGHGRILNMSSMMAKTPCPFNALYGAAKVFVLSFTTALSAELEGTGVTATTVVPGATRTNFPINAGIADAPAWKYFSMSSDETAIRIYRALMQGKRCVVTGWYNKMGAMWTRAMPLGMQLKAGTWLIGTRKHPLDHEGVSPTGGYDPQRGRETGGEGEGGSGGSGKGGKKRYVRKHPLGRDGKRGWYQGGDSGTDHRPEPWPANARPQDPCGGGRGWRAATIGCERHRQQNAQDGQKRDGSQAGDRGFQPASGTHHGPTRDGVPANLGRFASHGPFAK